MWKSIKENWSQIMVLSTVFLVVTGAYVDFRSGVKIDARVKAFKEEQALIIVAEPAEVAANTESIVDLEEEDEKMDNKIERIVGILIE